MTSTALLESPGDKRHHPRISCEIPAKIRPMDPEDIPAPSNGTRLAGVPILITDLSLGGAFMECLAPLKGGKLYQMRIELPKPYSPLAAFAEVRWTSEKGGGVKFLAVQEDRLRDLELLIKLQTQTNF